MSIMARLDSPQLQGIRTILVPQDIVGVRSTAPARSRVRTRTPLRRDTDGQTATQRCGEREWFSDKLFVERQDDHARSGFGTSVSVHLFGVAAILVFLISQPDVVTIHMPSLPMPAIVAPPPPPAVDIPAPTPAAPAPTREQKTTTPPAPPPPAPVADKAKEPDAAPVQPPSGVSPETGNENSRRTGVDGGVPGGIPGGVAGGVIGGAPASGTGGTGTAPVRVGPSMQAPRKIKDVKPVFPQGALPSRSQGAVVIEAVIGTDGKVQSAKVIHSVPALDQAALDAVRQWEYTPPMLNGAPVAVIMTVVVNFAMQ
jgi:protein TonB